MYEAPNELTYLRWAYGVELKGPGLRENEETKGLAYRD